MRGWKRDESIEVPRGARTARGRRANELAARYAAGDRSVGPELLACLAGVIKAEVLRCSIPPGSGCDVDDLIQHATLRVWKYLDKYDPSRSAISTWATRTAWSACQTYFERRGNRALRRLSDEQTGRLVSPGAAVPDAVAGRELTAAAVARVQAALGRLPERQRDVLARGLGLDGGEPENQGVAARRLGVCSQRVAQLRKKGLQSLAWNLGISTAMPYIELARSLSA